MRCPPRNRLRQIGAAVLLFFLAGCTDETPDDVFQGYIEGEFVYIGAPLAGVLKELPVERGGEVTEGTLMFVLEHESEAAALAEAEAG